MPDNKDQNPASSTDPKKAEKYVNTFVALMDENKVEVIHTDLTKLDPTSLQDHYWLDLKEYKVEISHSKSYESGKDSYVLIFNNLKNIDPQTSQRVILAYINLTEEQFIRFKEAADNQIERKRREEEERRFNSAMGPIEKALKEIGGENILEKSENDTQAEAGEGNKDYYKAGPDSNPKDVKTLSDYSHYSGSRFIPSSRHN